MYRRQQQIAQKLMRAPAIEPNPFNNSGEFLGVRFHRALVAL